MTGGLMTSYRSPSRTAYNLPEQLMFTGPGNKGKRSLWRCTQPIRLVFAPSTRLATLGLHEGEGMKRGSFWRLPSRCHSFASFHKWCMASRKYPSYMALSHNVPLHKNIALLNEVPLNIQGLLTHSHCHLLNPSYSPWYTLQEVSSFII